MNNTHDLLKAILAALLLAVGMSEADARNYVATGQTDCWDSNGAEIKCKKSGQDGETQVGIGYKKFDRYMGFKRPTKRFEHDGAWVTDKLTGLRWYIEIGYECGAFHTWNCALQGVKRLGGRLPNLREIQTMIEYMPDEPNEPPLDDHNTMIVEPEPVGYHTQDVQQVWSSTTCPHKPDYAYVLNLESGEVFCERKDFYSAADWAVKDPKRWMMK